VREYLSEVPDIFVDEKRMFNVLNFMVNGKTCVCVSGEKLMLRFDPSRQEAISEMPGYETMMLKGKEYRGYCYISPEGFRHRRDFEFFLRLCLDYNKVAKSSKKRKVNGSAEG
jgi:hypothetical protein